MDKKKRNYIIVALLAGIVFVYAVWPGVWWSLAKSFNPAPAISFSAGEVEGWETYSDPVMGYQFKYPREFKIVDNSSSPLLDGAVKEIVVEKENSQGKPDVFFTIDTLGNDFIGMGGIDFSMNGEKTGSIGCDYGTVCRIYLERNNTLVLVKSSFYPWQMMDEESRKILATLRFEPSQSDKNQ